MTREQGLKRLRQVLGQKSGARIGLEISSPERRADEHRKRLQRSFRAAMLDRDCKYIRERILAASPAYQTARAEADAVRRDIDAHNVTPYYKFTVGLDMGWAFEVRASGDTWEEVLDQLQQKKEQSA